MRWWCDATLDARRKLKNITNLTTMQASHMAKAHRMGDDATHRVRLDTCFGWQSMIIGRALHQRQLSTLWAQCDFQQQNVWRPNRGDEFRSVVMATDSFRIPFTAPRIKMKCYKASQVNIDASTVHQHGRPPILIKRITFTWKKECEIAKMRSNEMIETIQLRPLLAQCWWQAPEPAGGREQKCLAAWMKNKFNLQLVWPLIVNHWRFYLVDSEQDDSE